ncbi:MAG: DUF695 domain-containing protein [Hymenobacteraceae bacterium]|nr:DUF695 domain-containing protein [Hymenobacteraceae bacterium]MDX5480442.1 DUF695 domain-containing protein [Hymenobacteraceae bacterium]
MEDNHYTPDWEFYIRNVDSKPGSIAVDLGLAEIAPVTTQPNLARISIRMITPRPDGLPPLEETLTLQSIEDELDTELRVNHKATYAGRMTSNGRRNIYFYLDNAAPCAQTIAGVMQGYSDYVYDLRVEEDKGWRRYFNFLYPEPEQLQSIKNRKVVDDLEKHGDNLNKEREVSHWVFFPSDADRAAFLSEVEQENFKVVYSDYDEGSGEYPFRLHISRKDKVDWAGIDKVVLWLSRQATKYNGEYDGWETAVQLG